MHEVEVRKATERFFEALNRMLAGDVAPMAMVWAHGPDVMQLGPFGRRRLGWDEVNAEFVEASQLLQGGHVEAKDLEIRVEGNMAFAACVEQGETSERNGKKVTVGHRATSIFRRDEHGEWKMAYHHTDMAPALKELASEQVKAAAGAPAERG
ncbi:MAG TPA: nuclear transport factor 2 family protein [Anaerolineae bacterium]|nr:nuclear transport factor 2 family protein [Anaerolineae bacterium]HOQ98281.1 nuclear transport factor 2 family protein [Anaerolineae bacterium]HPL27614.1 nuclear transport factor 2 family protein [Anaerolineae bacterium]